MPQTRSKDHPGAKYSPSPKLFNMFWDAMDRLTRAEPLSKERTAELNAERRAAAFHKVSRNLSEIKSFVDDIEKVIEKIKKSGGKTQGLDQLIGRLKHRITIIDVAVGATDDAIQAAQEVQTDLSAWYRDAYAKCRTDSTADPFRDHEFVCLAAIDRLYQARNVKFVLGSQDGSFVRRVFDKWRDRLKLLVLPI